MDCRDFLSRYSEYDDSLVSPAEADRFRSHMAICESCTRYDRVLRKGRMLARQLPDVEPSDDFVPRLRMRLWQESHGGTRLTTAPGRVTAALPAVTVLLAALALLGQGAPRALAAVPDGVRLALVTDREGAPVQASAPAPGLTGGAGRIVTLPPTGPLEAREWGVERVDREGPASYSPLVTGLPADPAARPGSRGYTSTYRTLD
jgi:hypothetical protein